MYIYWFSFESG